MPGKVDAQKRHLTRLALGMTLGFVMWGGCARQPEPLYELQSKTQSLTNKQQQQIQDHLLRHFGTPLHPHLRLELADAAQGDSTAESADNPSANNPSANNPSAAKDSSEIFSRAHLEFGARVFQDRCAGCHGSTGDGNGEVAAFLQPKPRDYRLGVFKFTSTPYGVKPTRQDLLRTVRKGAKGTSMPAFALLSDEELESVVDYVVLLAYRGELEQKVVQFAATELDADANLESVDFADNLAAIHEQWKQAETQIVMPLSPQPPYSDETIAQGRKAFLTRGCSKCHGEEGKGQTAWLSSEFLAQQASAPPEQRVQINYDTWGHTAPAADLTSGLLHGGRRKIDIYRRIHNGINGTPMPSFGQALATEPETIWHLVHYVTSVVEGRPLPKEAQTSPASPETTASE